MVLGVTSKGFSGFRVYFQKKMSVLFPKVFQSFRCFIQGLLALFLSVQRFSVLFTRVFDVISKGVRYYVQGSTVLLVLCPRVSLLFPLVVNVNSKDFH